MNVEKDIMNFIKKPSFTRILYRLKYCVYELLNPDYPWMTPTVNSILNNWLSHNMKGFEWGSGRSTIFFAQKVNHLVSIEHDAYWFKFVNLKLNKYRLNNVSIRLIPPLKTEEMIKIEWKASCWENKCIEKDPHYSIYYNYVNVINSYKNEYFDFILIDGKARIACALNAIPKLKKGGLLILDNSKFFDSFTSSIFTSWKRIHTTDQYVGDTNIWIKPRSLNI